MSGVIRARDVFAHAPLVIREYGWRVFLRCVVAALTRSHATFLSIVYS